MFYRVGTRREQHRRRSPLRQWLFDFNLGTDNSLTNAPNGAEQHSNKVYGFVKHFSDSLSAFTPVPEDYLNMQILMNFLVHPAVGNTAISRIVNKVRSMVAKDRAF